MVRRVLILDNRDRGSHPDGTRLLHNGEIVHLNITKIVQHQIKYSVLNNLENVLCKSRIKILNDKFIDVEQIKNLPDHCFVRSR